MVDLQQYLDSFDEDNTAEDYNASGDTTLKNVKNHLYETRKHDTDKKEASPYSNKELHKFINYLGFQAEEVPRFSEMAKKLNAPIVHENVKKDLTNLDNHDMIKDVSPSRKNDELDIKKQALRRLIAKYKG